MCVYVCVCVFQVTFDKGVMARSVSLTGDVFDPSGTLSGGVCVCTYVCVRVCVYMCVSMCMCVCTCACMCVCVLIRIYFFYVLTLRIKTV